MRAGVPGAGFQDEIGIGQRRGAEHRAAYTRAQPVIERGHIPNSAAELHRDLGHVEDARDGIGVDRPALDRAVQVDHVEPLEAERLEHERLIGGIVIEHRRLGHVAAHEAHAQAVLDVDRREQDHGRPAPPVSSWAASGASGSAARRLE